MDIPVSAHSYLGETDDLQGRADLLEEGITYNLPLLPLDGCILCPGDILPLRVLAPTDRLALRVAMQAPPPLSRLIAVVCCGDIPRHGNLLHFESVGCTAEVVKMSADGVNVVTLGRQRIRIDLERSPQPLSLQRIATKIIPDTPPRPIPPCAAANQAAWPRWVYKQFDAATLAHKARELFAQAMPRARCFVGDAMQLSFWLIGNLPFDNDQRQRLLEISNAVERLSQEIEWLKQLTTIKCLHCGGRVGHVCDLVQLSDEGVGAHYVNSHGVVHDMLTIEKAEVYVVGQPEPDHSWFPGYAWQIAYCLRCRMHLGWVFSIIETPEQARNRARFEGSTINDAAVPVQRFFGLRRMPLTNNLGDQDRFHMNFELPDEEDSEYSDSEESEDPEEAEMRPLAEEQERGGGEESSEDMASSPSNRSQDEGRRVE